MHWILNPFGVQNDVKHSNLIFLYMGIDKAKRFLVCLIANIFAREEQIVQTVGDCPCRYLFAQIRSPFLDVIHVQHTIAMHVIVRPFVAICSAIAMHHKHRRLNIKLGMNSLLTIHNRTKPAQKLFRTRFTF